MIKIILLDRWNPARSASQVFETTSPVKASRFIQSLKSSLDYNQWEIKTEVK
jgi:hypothetical protein